MSEIFRWETHGPRKISECYALLMSHKKRKELSLQELEALAHIMLIWTHAGKGYAYFSVEWLGLKLGVHRQQCTRILRSLVLKGYIKRQRRDPTSCYKTTLTFAGNKLMFLLYQTRVNQNETKLFHRMETFMLHNKEAKRVNLEINSFLADELISVDSSTGEQAHETALAASPLRATLAQEVSSSQELPAKQGEATEGERRALRKRYQELTQEIEKGREERRDRQEEVQQADAKSQREVEKARKAELKKQLAELRARGD